MRPPRIHHVLAHAAIAAHVVGAADLPRCKSSTFDSLLSSNVSIEVVTTVDENGEYGEGSKNLGYPNSPKGLPELCTATFKVITSGDSSFRFGVFLPKEWNSNMLAVGNGGFAGGINWMDMAPGSHYGFATFSTDTGHNSNVTDVSWARGNEEKRQDWGWRALHGTVVLGKQIVKAYYEKDVKKSYYNGCSTGGRMGLREMQEFPDSFDGVLVGAPAWNPTLLNPFVTQIGIYNLPMNASKRLNTSIFPVIGDEVVRLCDELDGVKDGIISSPELCKVDLSGISCDKEGVNKSACLTKEQTEVAMKIYEDYKNSKGDLVWPGYLPGSEDQWFTVLGSGEPTPFGVGFARYFVYDDPSWNWRQYNESLIENAVEKNPGKTRADKYDLSDFKNRGGKMIMYHGMADGLVPTKGSTLYYDRVSEKMGGRPTDFFRYFLVPGMQHCWATTVAAPWNFAGAFQPAAINNDTWSVPGFRDSQHDMLLALVDWVEQGKAVDSVIATTWKTSNKPDSGVARQRPLCPYPQKAVFDGNGNANETTGWQCKAEEQKTDDKDDKDDKDEDAAIGVRPSLGVVCAVLAVLATVLVGL